MHLPRGHRHRAFGLGLMAAMVLTAIRPALAQDTPPIGAQLVGKSTTDLRFVDASGSVLALDQAGVVYLVDSWALGCPPCDWEMPDLIRLSNDLAHEPRFRFVSVLYGWSPEILEEARARNDLGDLVVYSDPESGLAKLGCRGFPTKLLVLDAKVVDAEVGGTATGTYSKWKAKVRKQLKRARRSEPSGSSTSRTAP